MPQTGSLRDATIFRDDALRVDYALHILVLGTDRPTPTSSTSSSRLAGRSDTMMLVRFDPKSSRMTLLSIPRDTRVPIPNFGTDKINATNAIGGPVLAAQVVSQLLGGIPIDRFIRLNTEGVRDLIDAIGGVEIYVPERMKYNDVTQNLHIDLQPGLQRLNGQQAHDFIRFRHNQLGDIGRVQRQQALIRALTQELLRPTTWSRTPLILDAVRQNLDTNMTWEELLSIARFMVASGQDRLDMVLLPGRFSQPHEYPTSYWIPDKPAIQELARTYFQSDSQESEPQFAPPYQLKIAVQNASGQPGMAGRLLQDLRQKGFTQVYVIEDDPQFLETTEIIAQKGNPKAAREVQILLGVGSVQVQSTGSIESDITVRVGQDWAHFWYPEKQSYLIDSF
jgi:LCP family protein required for cell wall assembly